MIGGGKGARAYSTDKKMRNPGKTGFCRSESERKNPSNDNTKTERQK